MPTPRTILEAHEKLERGEVSSTELVNNAYAEIEKKDGTVRAFLTLTKEQALEQAHAVDAKHARGETLGFLEGVPYALKDNMCVEGVRTTAASHILHDYIAPYTATAIEKLSAAGAILLGKTNLDAFAHGSSTETSDFQVTTNPLDETRIAGGSSGGSAAAVAAGMSIFGIGSETGGSIRQPASLCGVVGMKPTYGRVSRSGLIAMGSSLDCIGPITHTVADAALVLETIAGADSKDATTSHLPVPMYRDALDENLNGVTIGVAEELFPRETHAGVKTAVDAAIKTLEGLGATIIPVHLPHARYASPVYAILCLSEISSNLARHDGIRYGYSVTRDAAHCAEAKSLMDVYMKSRQYGFGLEAKRRILLGTYALSAGYYDAYYKKAAKVRTLIREDWKKVFESVDVVVSPTIPTVAPKLGEAAKDPLFAFLADELIMPSTMAGLPGITVPCGTMKPDDGDVPLPIGLQIVGRQFDEASIFHVAFAFEQAQK